MKKIKKSMYQDNHLLSAHSTKLMCASIIAHSAPTWIIERDKHREGGFDFLPYYPAPGLLAPSLPLYVTAPFAASPAPLAWQVGLLCHCVSCKQDRSECGCEYWTSYVSSSSGVCSTSDVVCLEPHTGDRVVWV